MAPGYSAFEATTGVVIRDGLSGVPRDGHPAEVDRARVARVTSHRSRDEGRPEAWWTCCVVHSQRAADRPASRFEAERVLDGVAHLDVADPRVKRIRRGIREVGEQEASEIPERKPRR